MLNDALEVNEQTVKIDHEGFLLQLADRNVNVACAIAEKEGVELTDDAWEVVMFVREYYETSHRISEHRRLLQALLR